MGDFINRHFCHTHLTAQEKTAKNHGCWLFYAITSVTEVSCIDSDKLDLGTLYFGNSQEVAECNRQYTSSSDSSEVSTPESIRRYFITGYIFLKVGSSGKLRL